MKLSVIQGIRALAANLVVVSHLPALEARIGRPGAVLPNLDALGRLGVLLFFVVSGFVIAMVASRSDDWRAFLWARVTRIYPIYWLYTALVVGAIAVAPAIYNPDVAFSTSVLRTILLVPDALFPVLPVAWSLLYEVLFYLIVTAFLVLRINLLAGLICWSIMLLLPIPSVGPISSVVLDPIAFNFIGGALLWIGVSKFNVTIKDIHLGWIENAGDASYSTYLSHVFVLTTLGAIFAAMPLPSHGAEIVFLIVCIVAANVWGWFSFRHIERPIIDLSRRLLERRKAPQPLGERAAG